MKCVTASCCCLFVLSFLSPPPCQAFQPRLPIAALSSKHSFGMTSKMMASSSKSANNHESHHRHPTNTNITQDDANTFAHTWFDAWEARDIDAILQPFVEDVEFHSPMVQQIAGDASGVIHDKATLREYFAAALNAYPTIDKEIYNVLVGVDSIAVYYRSVNNLMACEVFFVQRRHNDSVFQCTKVLNNYRSNGIMVGTSLHLADIWMDAWNSRNFDDLKDYFTPDVTLTSPFLRDTSKLSTLVGINEVIAYFELVLERKQKKDDGMRFALVDALEGKDSVAVLYDVKGHSGIAVGRECVIMYLDVATGKVKSIWNHHTSVE